MMIQKIDNFIFAKINQMQDSPQFIQLIEPFTKLSESEQKIINKIFNIILLLVPVLITVIIFISNSSVKSDIALKEDLINQIQVFYDKTQGLNRFDNKVLSTRPVLSKSELNNRITGFLKNLGISPQNILLDKFELENEGNVTIAKVKIVFNKFTAMNLSGLIKSMVQKEKIKIFNLEVTKSSNQLLNGTMTVKHYAKGK